MRRVCILLAVLSPMVAALAVLPAAAQSLPSTKEAAALVEKAEEHRLIVGPTSAPFHIAARIHYTDGNNSFDGTYEVLWAAPGRYREEFRLGDIAETDVALDDKLYVLRSIPVLSYPQWKLRGDMDLLNRPLLFHPGLITVTNPLDGPFAPKLRIPQPRVSKVYASSGRKGNIVCSDFAEPSKGLTECLDPATDRLVYLNYQASFARSHLGLVEDRFISLGDVNYPGFIVSKSGKESLEINVDKLEAVVHFADDVFVPPAGASERDWCAAPEIVDKEADSGALIRVSASMFFSSRPKGFRGYFTTIGTDGRVKTAAEVYADGTLRASGNDDLTREHWPLRTCAGKPITYEAMFPAPLN
jgi:hypothetical protein